MCQPFAKYTLYKKGKDMIHITKLKNIIETRTNNAFIMLVIFEKSYCQYIIKQYYICCKDINFQKSYFKCKKISHKYILEGK